MGNYKSKQLLDKQEVKYLKAETNYDEETIQAWFTLFSKYSNNTDSISVK